MTNYKCDTNDGILEVTGETLLKRYKKSEKKVVESPVYRKIFENYNNTIDNYLRNNEQIKIDGIELVFQIDKNLNITMKKIIGEDYSISFGDNNIKSITADGKKLLIYGTENIRELELIVLQEQKYGKKFLEEDHRTKELKGKFIGYRISSSSEKISPIIRTGLNITKADKEEYKYLTTNYPELKDSPQNYNAMEVYEEFKQLLTEKLKELKHKIKQSE